MDRATRWNLPGVDLQPANESGRCAICAKSPSDSMFTLHERFSSAEDRHMWLLCERCAAAVVTEVTRSDLRTPLRLRIAVGIVAANRRCSRRTRHMRPLTIFGRGFWMSIPARQLDQIVLAFVYCMFALPPLVFLVVLLVTIITRTVH